MVCLLGCSSEPELIERLPPESVLRDASGAIVSVNANWWFSRNPRRAIRADGRIRQFASIQTLRQLTLKGGPVSDYTVQVLSEMPRLSELDLDWTSITDESLQYLAASRVLTALSLRGTQITDRGVGYLRGHPTLSALDLSRTDVTEAALEYLGECPALSSLTLCEVDIGDDAIQRFKAKHPSMIVYSGGRKPKDRGIEMPGPPAGGEDNTDE